MNDQPTSQQKPQHTVPLVWAGPLVRRLESKRVVLWLMTSEPFQFQVKLWSSKAEFNVETGQLDAMHQQIKLGSALYWQCLDLKLDQALPEDQWINYDISLMRNQQQIPMAEWLAAELLYADNKAPKFVFKPNIKSIVHGSCRKAHAQTGDGLLALDQFCAEQPVAKWPSALVMSGDQVYVDEVAGPMLKAVHQLIPHLGINTENLPGAKLANSDELHEDLEYLYGRQNLLPTTKDNDMTVRKLFGGIKKPIFTTVHGGNHLMSFAEIVGLYLLSFSAVPWQFVDLQLKLELSDDLTERFQKELKLIEDFAEGMPKVQRVLAHMPTAMIFDDHDVTDDWNLSIAWEKAAYTNPLGKRIIGNALLGYLIFQGWGNSPDDFSVDMMQQIQDVINNLGKDQHDQFIDTLLQFRQWDYTWPTEPKLVVMDSRTNRWRSEKSDIKPSGLMDWESICQLQQELINHKSVILVSPAPVFGVKLIEIVQRFFTLIGKPLLVDAENWMAHPGAAYALMNIFRHPKTPEHFTILSGDVHYSFVYDVELKGPNGGPHIWQITSSGIKNQFPEDLLNVLDRMNRWLFSPRSPLNWFTKRRSMRIVPYKPENASAGERLVNDAGLGMVEFDDHGKPIKIWHLSVCGKDTEFLSVDNDARWA